MSGQAVREALLGPVPDGVSRSAKPGGVTEVRLTGEALERYRAVLRGGQTLPAQRRSGALLGEWRGDGKAKRKSLLREKREAAGLSVLDLVAESMVPAKSIEAAEVIEDAEEIPVAHRKQLVDALGGGLTERDVFPRLVPGEGLPSADPIAPPPLKVAPMPAPRKPVAGALSPVAQRWEQEQAAAAEAEAKQRAADLAETAERHHRFANAVAAESVPLTEADPPAAAPRTLDQRIASTRAKLNRARQLLG